LDTKDFKWGFPSPTAHPDVIIDSTPPQDTSCQPEPEEWPDWSSDVSCNSKQQQKQQASFSSSLKFDSNPSVPHPTGMDKAWNEPLEIGAETESLEDPFPAVATSEWQSEYGDFLLTLSPSQSVCLAQCTGDLKELDRKVLNLHKH
jgi:hypothetical protein